MNKKIIFLFSTMLLQLLVISTAAASFPIADSGNEELNSAVAYNSIEDHYLVVYEYEWSETDHDIRAKFIDSSGTEILSFVVTQTTESETNPKTAYNSTTNEFIIVWEHDTTTGYGHDIKAKIIDADDDEATFGNTVAEWIPAGWPGDETDPDVEYNPDKNQYMVVWVGGQDDNDIYVRIFDASGGHVYMTAISPGEWDDRSPSLVYNPDHDNYLVLWHAKPGVFSSYGIYGRIVGNNGSLGTLVDFGDTVNNNLNPRVSWDPDPGEYLVVMEEGSPDNSVVSVKGQRLSGTGATLGSIFTISGTGASNRYGFPDIAYDSHADEFVVSYAYEWTPGHFMLNLRQVSSGGNMVPSEGQVPWPYSYPSENFPAIASGATSSYLLVWQNSLNAGDIYGLILKKPAVTTDPAGYITTNSAQLRGWLNPNGFTTSYYFEYGPTSEYGSSTPVVPDQSGTLNQWKYENITGLQSNSTYHFRIVANNQMLKSVGGDVSFHTDAEDPTVLTTSADVGSTLVTLNGVINPNGANTDYFFRYGETPTYGSNTVILNAGSGRTLFGVSQNLTVGVSQDLKPNQTYHYTLVGRRGVGSVFYPYEFFPDGNVSFTTAAVLPSVTTSAPSHITATQVRFNGTVWPNNDATWCYFQYGPDINTLINSTTVMGPFYGMNSISVNFLKEDMPPGDSGVFRLVAYNAAGTKGADNHQAYSIWPAPAINTTGAAAISSDSATLSGQINPQGSETSYWFKYWITTDGEGTAIETAPPKNVGSGSSPVTVIESIITLLPGRNYTYQLCAENSWGEQFCSDETEPPSFDTEHEFYEFKGMFPSAIAGHYFAQPRGIATDSRGYVYVADSVNHIIQKFTPEGHEASEPWGTFGVAERDLNGNYIGNDIIFWEPSAVAVDRFDNVYVADTFNQRIQKFTPEGKLITRWDINVPLGGGEVPFCLAVSDLGEDQENQLNAVYVGIVNADVFWSLNPNSRIQVFVEQEDDSYNYHDEFGGGLGTGDGQFDFGSFWNTWGGDIDIQKTCSIERKVGGGIGFRGYSFELVCSEEVFVADYLNNRVQKFFPFSEIYPSGLFLDKWQGAPGQDFIKPEGIAAAPQGGEISVLDAGNSNIKVFSNSGSFIRQYPDPSDQSVHINSPRDICVNKAKWSEIYMVDAMGAGVQKFDAQGGLIAKWAGNSALSEEFDWPGGVCFDDTGNIYIADINNHRIQKFDLNMNFIEQWYKSGDDSSEEWFPRDIAFSPEDPQAGIEARVVVAGRDSVQVFDLNGVLKLQFPGLVDPYGVAVDSDSNILITDTVSTVFDTTSPRIYKYDKYGTLIFSKINDGADPPLAFSRPAGVACDTNDNIYVLDIDNSRVVKMNSSGGFETQWGVLGAGDGQFFGSVFGGIKGITVGNDGFVYVSDTFNHRVQKFTLDGDYVNQFGKRGFGAGEFNFPGDISIDSDGKFWVADIQNHRMQVFNKRTLATNNKAIILGGGGKKDNALWDATKTTANIARKALQYQGYDPEDIRFLSAENEGNDQPVEGVIEATKPNFWAAIDEFTLPTEPGGTVDTTKLTIFLADHGGVDDGGNGKFWINSSEILTADELQNKISQIDPTIPVVLVVDTCHAGTFSGAANRTGDIVVTSSREQEDASFASGGRLSYSVPFWSSVFKGRSLGDSHSFARDQILSYSEGSQNADLINYSSFDPAAIYLGNANTVTETPVMDDAGIIIPPGSNTGTIWVTGGLDPLSVSTVQAVIYPPHSGAKLKINPIIDYPTVNLKWDKDESRWEGEYKGFNYAGDYRIKFHGQIRRGFSISDIERSIYVDPTKQRKAVIVVGGETGHENWPAFKSSAEFAYQALREQGYPEGNIDVWSPGNLSYNGAVISSDSVNKTVFLGLEYSDGDTKDLVVYLVGPGAYKGFEVFGNLEGLQMISTGELSTWLGVIKAAVIYEGDYSGSFIEDLSETGKDRIIITSTVSSGRTRFIGSDYYSLSTGFWNEVFNGKNTWDAYQLAKNQMITFTNGGQIPWINDDEDDICCEIEDGEMAKKFIIGDGKKIAPSNPKMLSVNDISFSGNSYTIQAQMSSARTLESVFAVITSPYEYGDEPESVIEFLTADDPGSPDVYETNYGGFSQYGEYIINLMAKDTTGETFPLEDFKVTRTDGPDLYEDDDIPEDANVIFTEGSSQRHNFDEYGDEDWIKFYALSAKTYEISTENLESNCTPIISLYDVAGVVDNNQDGVPDGPPILEDLSVAVAVNWPCPVDGEGMYYLRVKQLDPSDYGENTGYNIKVFLPVGNYDGFFQGYVFDENYDGVDGALVKVIYNDPHNNGEEVTASTPTKGSGLFSMNNLVSGLWPVRVEAQGFSHAQEEKDISTDSSKIEVLQVTSQPDVIVGDIDGDGEVTVDDLNLVMDVLTGQYPSGDRFIRDGYADSGADVDGDNAIGPAELIYIRGLLSL